MLKKSRQIINYFLIVLFTLYYVDICFFYHSHIINGATIVHSHFHNKAHEQTGTHSSSQLTLISLLSAFQSFQAPLPFLSLEAVFLLLAVICYTLADRAIHNPIVAVSPRAPPSLL